MKKRIIQASALVLAALTVVSIHRMGDRRITVTVLGRPAAGQTLESVTGSERITLDADGSAELPWGLAAETPSFVFTSEPDRNWVLRLPERGQLTYRIDGDDITTETTTLDLYIFEIGDRVEQRRLSDG